MQFTVSGMTCDGCVRAVTRAIQRIDAAAAVEIDLDSGTVAVTSNHARPEIAAAIDAAGYTVEKAS